MNNEKKLPTPDDITADQTRDVLEWLLKYGTITTAQAIYELHITRLSARIWDLRHMGFVITGVIRTKTVDGKVKRWMEYRLEDYERLRTAG